MKISIATKITLFVLVAILFVAVLYSLISTHFINTSFKQETLEELDVQACDDVSAFKDELRNELNKRSLITALLLIITFIPLSLYMARTLSEPIIELKDAAEELSKGNLEVTIDVKSKDEVGELSKVFNYMAQELKKLTHNLGKQIKKKTKDLEKSKKILEKKVEELEKWKRVTIGRESKMIRLKKQVSALEEDVRRLRKKKK